jgi:hypothetical protein
MMKSDLTCYELTHAWRRTEHMMPAKKEEENNKSNDLFKFYSPQWIKDNPTDDHHSRSAALERKEKKMKEKKRKRKEYEEKKRREKTKKLDEQNSSSSSVDSDMNIKGTIWIDNEVILNSDDGDDKNNIAEIFYCAICEYRTHMQSAFLVHTNNDAHKMRTKTKKLKMILCEESTNVDISFTREEESEYLPPFVDMCFANEIILSETSEPPDLSEFFMDEVDLFRFDEFLTE